MGKANFAAVFFGLFTSAASASTMYINNGSVIDFSNAAVGSTSRINVEFSLGVTWMDESLNFIIGPTFQRVSGQKKPLSFDSVDCYEIGSGLICNADAVFKPKTRKDYSSTYDISALINFEEIHDEEQPNVNEFTDSFRVNLRGSGVDISAVPLPAAAWSLIAALSMLAWFGRRRRGMV